MENALQSTFQSGVRARGQGAGGTGGAGGAELRKTGELLEDHGLAFPSTAKTVSYDDGQVAVTDGPYAESKESLAGFWIIDVSGEERAVELAGRVAFWARQVELREVHDRAPEFESNPE
ncbi:hypothetical protein JIG36_39310 [Actinoplanes sp. LDG1-06]|uniref:YCII-related domain-containing protein n=1 Tax=Paractinoplanes ovalisporus TaxID=2810368 RepID=A0ABS2AP65_9ACTN|nr:YciI family protein [Actinoplanes ovalisporus]MBM2621571.1 hypothetical protein [Actinoplanes ovalisporus]